MPAAAEGYELRGVRLYIYNSGVESRFRYIIQNPLRRKLPYTAAYARQIYSQTHRNLLALANVRRNPIICFRSPVASVAVRRKSDFCTCLEERLVYGQLISPLVRLTKLSSVSRCVGACTVRRIEGDIRRMNHRSAQEKILGFPVAFSTLVTKH